MFTHGASLHQVALILDVSPKTIYKYIPAEQRLRLPQQEIVDILLT
ncbi:hypothetical protein [Yersinia wautersii]